MMRFRRRIGHAPSCLHNYGGASAVAFFTPNVPVISVHNQYWLWGTRDYFGEELVQIGGSCFKAEHLYASRTVVTTFSSRYGIARGAASADRDLPRIAQTAGLGLGGLQRISLSVA